MKVKAKCAWALIRYLKAKESERENSNELCKTKLYYATCRHRVCGQIFFIYASYDAAVHLTGDQWQCLF